MPTDKKAYREKVAKRKVWIPGRGIQERAGDETHFTSEPGEFENLDENEGGQPISKEAEEPEPAEPTEESVAPPVDQPASDDTDQPVPDVVPKASAPEVAQDAQQEPEPPRVEVKTPEWAQKLEDKLDEDQLKALSEMPRDYLLFPRHHNPITIEWLLGDHGSLKMDYDIVYLWEGQDTGDQRYPDRVVIRTRSDRVFIPADRKDLRFRIITEGDGSNIRFQGFRESYILQKDPFGYTMFSIIGEINRDSDQSSLSLSTGYIKSATHG